MIRSDTFGLSYPVCSTLAFAMSNARQCFLSLVGYWVINFLNHIPRVHSSTLLPHVMQEHGKETLEMRLAFSNQYF